MYLHAPKDYLCPICLGLQGVESEATLLKQADLVFKDDLVSVFINSFWIGKNEGHLIVVPNEHFENLYVLPKDVAHRIMEVSQRMAIALKNAYKCDGVMIRQNNEPASDQHAFHYHFHVFPRYEGDALHKNMMNKKSTTQEERKSYAEKIKSQL